MKLRSLLALLVGSALLFGPLRAEAQSRRAPPPPRKVTPVRPRVPARPTKPTRPKPSARQTPTRSLKSRIGFDVAVRLLSSDQSEARRRGLERLGAVGTPAALELLAKSLEPGGSARTTEERLTAVRALAEHAPSPVARPALSRVMASASTDDESEQSLIRGTAALALARSGQREAVELLSKALRQEGPVAAAAAMALVAYPPRDLRPLVSTRGSLTLGLIAALEQLADQRAFQALRSFVKHGPPEYKARAALALTRLGDYETVALAKHWLAKERDPALRLAATQILALSNDPSTASAIAGLLARPASADQGISLALERPSAALVPVLAPLLERAEPSNAPPLLGAIGRAGGAQAARVLAKQLTEPRRATLAAYALALAPGPDARDAIEHALTTPETRRLAARAAVIRVLRLGEPATGLRARLDALLTSSDAADRAAGAWGHAALDQDRAVVLLGRKDDVVVRAAARAALSPRAARAAADRLVDTKDATTRTALAIALADSTAADRVPTHLLLELIEDGGAAAPLAARALAARDDATQRPGLVALLASGDPLIRSHVALGLGESADPSVVGLLADRYRFEREADVRHAIVVALSRRSEATREKTLRLAADLDGDTRVRQAARRALGGSRLSPLPAGTATFWLELVDSASGRGRPHAALLGSSTGLALPVVADPDGLITLGGLPDGPVSLRLAPAGAGDNASGR